MGRDHQDLMQRLASGKDIRFLRVLFEHAEIDLTSFLK